ncbi:RHS repeat-associated core domain-containing protein [Yersinia pseudotuberculosis]|uniref:RHS repeat-associated core domain-containing protein n=1 Tax=Yersinia pseudotuberculosis TaxID=633 RepID=UPI00034B8163|nr:RHS repeat-associated core domain-containing protein [Yersinia pseudotuberculosis]QES99398.1 type IV secretion protein Rhs [Yersinia pseudotuberculosis]CFU95262.1 RHS/YD repeat-containing protein [Yersinia pseudotuberculosis]CNB82362.1 RHS/YD repeat-containing protein [Yersinia pseudotuberculosis]CNB98184.1 RHS/YD repeat-containing protein [Yersinia pseudotuberculosis]CRY61346.1 RHS/YD repeat-containing protein [Yersinia pseudotuberculosis]
MLEAAARVGDAIGHSQALAGLIGGTILGGLINVAGGILGGMLFAAGCASACLGVGILLIGASIAVGMAANALGEKARDACVDAGKNSLSPSGAIVTGSANVRTNSKAAAVATLSAVTCDKDKAQQVAQGSSSVFINGLPAARRNDKTTCDASIIVGSTNVFIGGGTETTLPITSEIPDWAYTVSDLTMFAAGLISFGGAVSRGPGAVQKLFAKLPGADKIAKIACRLAPLAIILPVVGILTNPVDVTSGQKFLNDEDERDFTLDGELPLLWQRRYLSSYVYEGVLGRGWNLFWESALSRVDDGILWRNTYGDYIPFPDIPAGHQTFCPEQQCWLIHLEDGRWCIRDAGEWVYHYGKFDAQGLAPLANITDNVGNRQSFHYNDQQQMVSITGTGGLSLRCDYHPERHRLTAVWQQTPDGDIIRARYQYNESGQLAAVQHRDDTVVRRFGWGEDHGLLLWHENVAGLRCDYQWQKIDDIWCVAEQHTCEGDGYRLAYDEERHQRTATYQDGSQAVWILDEQHRVSRYTDRTGHECQLQWDTAGQPTGYRSPQGHQRQCQWDELGRLVSVTDANGAETRWQYERNTDRQTFVFWPDGTQERQQWDAQGRLLQETDRLGQSTYYTYPHPRTLLPDSITDALGGQSQLLWSQQGQLTGYTDCSGQPTQWRYDALGQLLLRRDALQQEIRYHWDPVGRLTKVTLPDGSTEQFDWSPAGQLVRHQQGHNQPRHWHYSVRGQILSTTDRLSRVIRYRYDAEGRLVHLDNDNGGQYHFNRDAEGRLLEEQRPDDTRYSYTYNADGQATDITQRGLSENHASRPEKPTRLTYDAVGRLIARHTLTEQTCYQWDKMGNLLSAIRTPTEQGEKLGILTNTVTFERDALGRITQEHNGAEALAYHYDTLGNLTRLELPNDDHFQWLHYGSGHVSAIRFNDQLVREFERDALHRETRRTQGILTQQRQYDVLGRRRWQSSISSRLTEALTTPEQGILWRAYHYDELHELAAVEDSNRGMLSYGYDEEGRLRSTVSPHSGQTTVHYDRADNALMLPLQTPESSPYARSSQPYCDNRLTRWEQWQYHYDAFGNLSERLEGYRTQRYRYDGDNRLVGAKGDGQKGLFEAQYHYDALGRRLSKVVRTPQGNQETHFLWQGLRLLQSRTDESQQTYCYDPNEAYTPLACIERRYGEDTLYWYHTDLNGSPQEVTNAQGEMVWSGQYGVFGQVTRQTDAMWRNVSKPLGQFRQPLRYAGQYLDNETGLHYTTYRYYAPEVGRFITPDPIGLAGGLNLYQYAPNPLGWIDPLGLAGNPATATHITYQGIDAATGKPYVGYASMQGNQIAQDVLKYRYANDFSRFGGQAPEILYDGYGQAGKYVTRGLEQRTFENLGGLDGTANKQNPVGQGNARRTEYLNAADEHLSNKNGSRKGGGGRC